MVRSRQDRRPTDVEADHLWASCRLRLLRGGQRLLETSKRVMLTVIALGSERVPLRENGDESHRALPLRSNQL
jgi:hypothetical protein